MKFDGRFLAFLIIIGGFGIVEIIKFIYNYKKLCDENEKLKSNDFDWSDEQSYW